MKRIFSLFLVLLMTVSIVACNKSGKGPALISTASTDTTSASSSGKESTSKIPIPPLPDDPAVSEINEAISKTVSADSYRYTHYRESEYADGSFKNVSYSGETVQLFSEGVLSVTDRRDSAESKFKNHKGDFILSGGYYYLSLMDIHAKLPRNEETDSVFDTEALLGEPSKKMYRIPSSCNISDKVNRDDTVYTVTFDAEDLPELLEEYLSGFPLTYTLFEKEYGTAKKITGAVITVYVARDGYIKSYKLHTESSVTVPELKDKAIGSFRTDEYFIYQSYGESASAQIPAEPEKYAEIEKYGNIPVLLFAKSLEKTDTIENSLRDLNTYIKIYDIGISTYIKAYTKIFEQNMQTIPVWLESTTFSSESELWKYKLYSDGNYFYIKDREKEFKAKKGVYEAVRAESVVRPSTPLSAEDIRKYTFSVYNDRISFEFLLHPESFRAKYQKLVDKALSFVETDHDILSVSVRDAQIYGKIDTNGYIEEYNVSYEIEIILNINGLKFAIKVSASESLSVLPIEEGVSILPPEGYEAYPEITNE